MSVESGNAAIQSDRLEHLRWKPEETYRVLSYYFSVRSNSARLRDFTRLWLRDFAVPPDPSERRSPPTPGLPALYAVVDLGRADAQRYRLFLSDAQMIASANLSDVLRHLFWHINAETVRQTGDFLLIHAGAVVSPAGEGILLPAESGYGKSTMVAGLVQAGFGYLSDEAAPIDPVARLLYPYPKALHFKKDPFAIFPDLRSARNGWPSLQNEWYLHADDIRPGANAGPCRIRFVIAPRYAPGAVTELRAVSRGTALSALVQNALNIRFYGNRGLSLLHDVAREARGYTLSFGNPQEAVQAVREVVNKA